MVDLLLDRTNTNMANIFILNEWVMSQEAIKCLRGLQRSKTCLLTCSYSLEAVVTKPGDITKSVICKQKR